ncbi:MAG: tryptophan-rich sensory protein [Acetobacteraceae bacterium]|nr:MAG: tryptophan-rich sensory protein [Acetobacteraceae bacterium]
MSGTLVETIAKPAYRGRISDRNLGLGLAVTAGAVLASALVSARYSPAPHHPRIRSDYERLEKPPFNPPDKAFVVWLPLYGALTLSGWRIWNSPRLAVRDRALGHWFGIQALNALWMWLGFGQRRRGAATVEAVVTVANAVAYVATARRIDPPAAALAVPYAAWIGFAALLSEELWRRNR